jgi:hypothetical protein
MGFRVRSLVSHRNCSHLSADLREYYCARRSASSLFSRASRIRAIGAGRSSLADSTVTPSDFTLTMMLADGTGRTYAGMTQAAPTYQKINPLGNQLITAYEVDPQTDLGRMGSVAVPAHGTISVTVTFMVPDAVANPNDNRIMAFQ